MTIVNNVTRMLDARKVPYEAHMLPVEKLGALEAAQVMGVPPEQVFKTIVVSREATGGASRAKKHILAVVPGPATVDLKLLAACLGEKKVFLPTEREAEQLTGLRAGSRRWRSSTRAFRWSLTRPRGDSRRSTSQAGSAGWISCCRWKRLPGSPVRVSGTLPAPIEPKRARRRALSFEDEIRRQTRLPGRR